MITPVIDIADLRSATAGISRSGKSYTTNFFASPQEISRWISTEALSSVRLASAVLVLRRDEGFHRLYHVASDTSSLSSALGCLPSALGESMIVADLIGRLESLEGAVSAYEANGFYRHARLVRMQRIVQKTAQECFAESNVLQARLNDVQRIREFLSRQLDPLVEQIPGLSQLNDAVSKGSVLIVLAGTEIAGLLIHDTTGLTTVLRYWHVGKRFRNLGIGAKLIRTFFANCESKRILLWVIADNKDAIAKYRHYEFEDDPMIDEILVKKWETA